MTTKELCDAWFGKRGHWSVPAGKSVLLVEVRVKDARVAYGRTDLLITPLKGSREAWVSADSVSEVAA